MILINKTNLQPFNRSLFSPVGYQELFSSNGCFEFSCFSLHRTSCSKEEEENSKNKDLFKLRNKLALPPFKTRIFFSKSHNPHAIIIIQRPFRPMAIRINLCHSGMMSRHVNDQSNSQLPKKQCSGVHEAAAPSVGSTRSSFGRHCRAFHFLVGLRAVQALTIECLCASSRLQRA